MACQSEAFDFSSLPILDEGVLLEGLRHRYERDNIYVSVITWVCSNENSSTLVICWRHSVSSESVSRSWYLWSRGLPWQQALIVNNFWYFSTLGNTNRLGYDGLCLLTFMLQQMQRIKVSVITMTTSVALFQARVVLVKQNRPNWLCIMWSTCVAVATTFNSK